MRADRVQASTADLADPKSSVWESIQGEELSLAPAPVEYQVTKYIRNAWKDRRYGVVESATVKAAVNDEVIAFRIEWQDSEHPDAEFPDACAVAFALSDSTPLQTFGSEQEPINLWFWRADLPDQAEDALARTMRDISPRDNGALQASASFSTNGTGGATSATGRWSVVICRSLQAGDGAAKIEPGLKARFAVLVWEGANEERAGLAAMTPDWQLLDVAN